MLIPGDCDSNHISISITARSVSPTARRTKYGCEGTTLSIDCDEGSAINLVRANYGRFSLSICNEYERSNFSINCLEPRSMRIVKNR
jgi:latrophilin 1